MDKDDELKTITEFIKQRTALFIILAFLLIIVFLVLVFINRKALQTGVKDERIKIQLTQSEITLNRNGLVEVRTPDGSFQKFWDSKMMDSFFQYANEKINSKDVEDGSDYQLTLIVNGQERSVGVSSNDSVINSIINQVTNGSGSGGPSPTSFFNQGGGSGGGSTGGGGGSTGGGSAGGGGSGSGATPTPGSDGSNCLFWTLSWCFLFPSPTPTGTQAVPTPTGYIQKPPDCDLYNQQVTKRTIISNTLCITDINPTP